jgi:hypothetical protein
VPVVEGAGAEVERVPWFAARGVREGALRAWFLANPGSANVHRVRQRNESEWLNRSVMNEPCYSLRVGDPLEDALVCLDRQPYDAHGLGTFTRASVVVVRGGRPWRVLDVVLGVEHADWPEFRLFDLALTFAADGRSVTLRDRAPKGTKVRMLPAELYGPGGVELHGCDEGLESAAKVAAGEVQGGGRQSSDLAAELNAETRRVRAVVAEACAARGRWSWKAGRFARDPA